MKDPQDYYDQETRDDEWREAICPGVAGSGTLSEKLVADPQSARLWLEAREELHREDIDYFVGRAERARIKRREAQSQLRSIAEAWFHSCMGHSNPHFPLPVEATLRAALPKKLRRDVDKFPKDDSQEPPHA